MHPGDTQAFYRSRRLLLVAGCAAPLLLLGAAWWTIDRFVLTPPRPTLASTADEFVRFLVDAKGLPKLRQAEREALIELHLRKWLAQEDYRSGFASALRRCSDEEREAFKTHTFDAVKPIIMRDVRRFHELDGEARRTFVDERIVEYHRMASILRGAKVDKSAFGDSLPSSNEVGQLVLAKTTEEERVLGQAFFAALAARQVEIQADEALNAEFLRRIEAATSRQAKLP